mmetsp:Transcript_1012/g.2737  ORF Transcript_1012/g.2737 Transcript_1012/m.2737 type:complete len:639 (-) Transcript_1012:560-2476(-)
MAWLCGSGSEEVATPSRSSPRTRVKPAVKEAAKDVRPARDTSRVRFAGSKASTPKRATKTKASARPPGHPSQRAVSLKWLLGTFMPQHPEIEQELMTTGEVVDFIVKPATEERQCCYADLIGDDDVSGLGALSSGQEFYFVSHPWSSPLVDTVAMLREHFNDDRQRLWRLGQPALPWSKVYIWLDLFAVNQYTEVGAKRFLPKLDEVLSDAVQNLLVLDMQGELFGRTWCLYEAWKSRAKSDVSIVMLTYDADLSTMEQALLDMDVRFSSATDPADNKALVAALQTEAGLNSVTQGLKDALVASELATIPSANLGFDAYALEQLRNTACLCRVYGHYVEAEELYERVLVCQENELGEGHVDTLDTVAAMANLMRLEGRNAEAAPLCVRVLKGRQSSLGASHPKTLQAVDALAQLHAGQGEYEEAEPLYKRALKMRQQTIGADAPETLSSVTNLGRLFLDSSKLDSAEPLLLRALRVRERTLGKGHLDTLDSVQDLAVLYCVQGKLDESEELFKRAVEGREQALGTDHPRTLMATHNYAVLLAKHGSSATAQPILERVANRRVKMLGEEHPDTLLSLLALAGVHEDLGHLPDAEALYRRVLRAQTQTLGAAHRATLETNRSLSQVLKAQGKSAKDKGRV